MPFELYKVSNDDADHEVARPLSEAAIENVVPVEADPEDTGTINTPFDPKAVRIERQSFSVSSLMSRISYGDVDLSPKFQRFDDIWTTKAQSQLIESLLIKVPLPAFYVDTRDDDKWVVIDGLQRMTTLRKFILDKSLKLKELEFLKDYNGMTFDELPRSLQRRINETELTFYCLRPGTPDDVAFNLFKRVNTGGSPLTGQEIRHALNQGKATDLLAKISTDSKFRESSAALKSTRMADRELILRALSFLLVSYGKYSSTDLDAHLNSTMKRINALSDDELQLLENRFWQGLKLSGAIFEEYAFRKPSDEFMKGRRRPISKSLFETFICNFSEVEDCDQLLERKKDLIERFAALKDDDVFMDAISQGTYKKESVVTRFERLNELIEAVCND